MEFTVLAAKETSALLARALETASKTSSKHVEALRAALDSASKALAEASTPDLERDVDEVVKRIAKAAAAEADAKLKHLSAEARKITDALRAELADVIGEKEAMAISLKEPGPARGHPCRPPDRTKTIAVGPEATRRVERIDQEVGIGPGGRDRGAR